MKYQLSVDSWNEEEIKAINDVIETNYFSMGKKVIEYEKNFANFFGAKYAVMTNSGSSANLLMIAAMVYSGKVGVGDEVLVTAVSWSTTYFPIFQHGLKIRFIDIDIKTLNVDIKLLEKAITEKTKIILAVNLLGNSNEFKKIKEICDERGIFLLEDNCESMGAEYDGKYTGTFGVIGTFSSFFSHHISTMEGGVCITDDEELYHFMLAIRSHGWTRQLPDISKIYTKISDPFYEKFNFIVPGYNIRPIEIEAAIGIEQLKKLNGFIEQRRLNADYFKKRISEIGLLTQQEIGKSSWFGFAIILPEKNKGERKKYVDALQKNDIEVRPIVSGNFVRQKALNFMDYSVYGELTNADYIHENGFFVGNYSVEMREQLDYLFDVIGSIV